MADIRNCCPKQVSNTGHGPIGERLRTPGFLVSFRSGEGHSEPRCSIGTRDLSNRSLAGGGAEPEIPRSISKGVSKNHNPRVVTRPFRRRPLLPVIPL